MVLFLSVAIIAAFVLWGLLSPAGLGAAATAAVAWTTSTFGWYYLLAVLGFLLFCLFLAFSRYGKIKLGRDDEQPEFSTAVVVRHAVQRGHGHRPGVLGRGRAGLATT